MGDTEQQPKKIESEILSVSPFRDPVEKANIASTGDNPLYGYYGYVRNQGGKRHPGFDYKTEEEPPYNSEDTKNTTNVYPVHKGSIVQVRFGRIEAHNKPSYVLLDVSIEANKEGKTVTKTKNRDGSSIKKIKTSDNEEIIVTTSNDGKISVELVVNGNKRDVIENVNENTKKTEYYYENNRKFRCPLIESINENHFYHETCSKCTDYFINHEGKYREIRSSCYGVQVWLKIKLKNKTVYAYYAHLSELNDVLSNILKNEYKEGKNNYNFKHEIEPDTYIGKIGRTGNAWNRNEVPVPHLHFECRTGIETGTQITPNNILKTRFMACYISSGGSLFPIGDVLDEIPKDEWCEFMDVREITEIINRKETQIKQEKKEDFNNELEQELYNLKMVRKSRWDNQVKQVAVFEW